MYKLVVSIIALSSSLALADVTIKDDGKTVTVDCAKDPVVTVLTLHAKVTVKGSCTKLAVYGEWNKVTADGTAKLDINSNHSTVTITTVDDIMVRGNYNTVTWSKTSDAKRTSPGKLDSGEHNTVTQKQ